MKKILISLPRYSSYFNPVKKSLKKLGFKVYWYDYRHGDYIAKMLKVIFGEKVANWYIASLIKLIVLLVKPNYFLTVKGEKITKDLIFYLKTKDLITINWYPDWLVQWDRILKFAKLYDYFFYFDTLGIERLKKRNIKNVYYLPFASEIDDDVGNLVKKYDVSFVGTYTKYREDILKSLTRFNLNIWGDERWLKSSLKKYTKGGRISRAEMNKVISYSKINLNIIYDKLAMGPNLRIFEVTGVKGFLLTQKVRNLNNLFSIGKEIESFDNKKELFDKVSYYLNAEKLRNNIAISGFRRAKKEHTYIIRLSKMFTLIDKSKNYYIIN